MPTFRCTLACSKWTAVSLLSFKIPSTMSRAAVRFSSICFSCFRKRGKSAGQYSCFVKGLEEGSYARVSPCAVPYDLVAARLKSRRHVNHDDGPH